MRAYYPYAVGNRHAVMVRSDAELTGTSLPRKDRHPHMDVDTDVYTLDGEFILSVFTLLHCNLAG